MEPETNSIEEPVALLQGEEIFFLRRFAQIVQPRIMIDVGAHHGATAAPFLRDQWEVHAFEPIEKNRQVLQKNTGNLKVYPQAVSDQCGQAQFHLAKTLTGELHDFYHSIEQIPEDPYHIKGETISVSTVTLDSLVENGELPTQVGVVKIDTEGHDLAVLRGMKRVEAQVVIVEFWMPEHALGKSPSPPEAMIDQARDLGYSAPLMIAHWGEKMIYCNSVKELPSDAWGNIMFFANGDPTVKRQADILVELLRLLPWSLLKFQAIIDENKKLHAMLYKEPKPWFSKLLRGQRK